MNPTRTGLLDALSQMGTRVTLENERDESGEPVADLIFRSQGDLVATAIGRKLVARMIDEFPILAVAATQARGETLVSEAGVLRTKESVRIAALTKELRKMGACIKEHADGFLIAGPTCLHGACVSAHSDHRLALSLAIAGLLAQGTTVIQAWECVADSFPDFGGMFRGLQ